MVMGIVFIMSGLSMANYNRFGRVVELENAAYELALNIRQAQFFGINRVEQFGSQDFDDPQPYGVFFSLRPSDPDNVINEKSFVFFVDRDDDKEFDLGDTNADGDELCLNPFHPSKECIDILRFTRNNYIDDICVQKPGGSCESITELPFTGQVHISFKRPDPDATIRAGGTPDEYSLAEITLKSPITGITEKIVSVGAAGLISVE